MVKVEVCHINIDTRITKVVLTLLLSVEKIVATLMMM
jgi:hypothetical protein